MNSLVSSNIQFIFKCLVNNPFVLILVKLQNCFWCISFYLLIQNFFPLMTLTFLRIQIPGLLLCFHSRFVYFFMIFNVYLHLPSLLLFSFLFSLKKKTNRFGFCYRAHSFTFYKLVVRSRFLTSSVSTFLEDFITMIL